MENISEIIKAKRLRAGLSQKRLASKAGVALRTLQSFEYNNQGSLRCLSAICSVLDLDIIIKDKEE